MKIVLLRVGIDTGSGGIHGPLFADGRFAFVPIPDSHNLDERTYSSTTCRHGRPLIDYFPPGRRRERMRAQSMHVDPEFRTFTYGDPSTLKGRLRKLERGDLLVFYAGLQGWDCPAPASLYIVGYFEVARAGRATSFTPAEIDALFAANFHVRHPAIYREQRDRLVLVKGSPRSRLLHTAVPISATGRDRRGAPLKVLSPPMQEIFGDFGGKISIQRSAPRWVAPEYTERAAAFVRSLR